MSELYPIYCPESQGTLDIGWIWLLMVHPRIRLFLWKVAWHLHPTRSFIILRGLHLPPSYLVCGTDDESLMHVLFHYLRTWQVWRMAHCDGLFMHDVDVVDTFLELLLSGLSTLLVSSWPILVIIFGSLGMLSSIAL